MSARLLLDLMPGLEPSFVFQDTNRRDKLFNQLCSWSGKSPEPLQSYAPGLLSAAMQLIANLTADFDEQNAQLTPVMLKRLWEIQKQTEQEGKHFFFFLT